MAVLIMASGERTDRSSGCPADRTEEAIFEYKRRRNRNRIGMRAYCHGRLFEKKRDDILITSAAVDEKRFFAFDRKRAVNASGFGTHAQIARGFLNFAEARLHS